MTTIEAESKLSYPGWKIALAGFFGVMGSFAAVVPYTFGLFLKPLSLAFGWRREALSLGFSIAALTVAAASPGLGFLLDRFGPRRIILPCILIFSSAYASLALLTPHLLHFYLAFFVIGLVGNGTAYLGYSRAISPEGTRSPTPRVGRFKKGAFHMAMQSGVPVVPIVIRNAGLHLWRGSVFMRKGTVDIHVLPPIPVDDWSAEDLDARVEDVHGRFVDTLADFVIRFVDPTDGGLLGTIEPRTANYPIPSYVPIDVTNVVVKVRFTSADGVRWETPSKGHGAGEPTRHVTAS